MTAAVEAFGAARRFASEGAGASGTPAHCVGEGTGGGNGMPVASRPLPVPEGVGDGFGGECLVMYRLPLHLAREYQSEEWRW